MIKRLFFLCTVLVAVSAWAQNQPGNFVFVEGGAFRNTKSNFHGKSVTLSSFFIGKHEVTQKEWSEVMGSNPSEFRGDNLPVEMVSWYDCVEYCNRRSINEGLKQFYKIDKEERDPNNTSDIDEIRWTVSTNEGTNGYRLPTEAEWEYAAGGGRLSQSFTYSGGDNIDKVAWYWVNSGDKILTGLWSWPMIKENHNRTKAIGGMAPNELGLYDMSGNVREWCWDWFGELVGQGTNPEGSLSGAVRVWRGGGWLGGDFCCASSFRGGYEANGRGNDQGFRVCRNR